MRLKSGSVRVKDIHPELIIGLLTVEDIYHEVTSDRRMIVTSCNDGVHGGSSGYNSSAKPPSNSFHYLGKAVDIRMNDIPIEKAHLIADMAAELLGEFDVVLESPGTSNCHLHCEYDPK